MTNPLLPYLAPLPLIAVLRGITPEEIGPVSAALAGEGFRMLEVPLNSPRPFDSIRTLATSLGASCLVGAGTVLTVDDVARVGAAGGRLIVMPHADTAIIREAKRQGLVCVPGVATPTEAFAALGAGADGSEDVSGRPVAARSAQGVARGPAQGRTGLRGQRHPAGQHGSLLGRGRRWLRHRIEPLPPGRKRGRRASRRGGLRGRVSRAADAVDCASSTRQTVHRPRHGRRPRTRKPCHAAIELDPTHARHRRTRRADARIQPGARRRAGRLPARLWRRHVEHGHCRVASPRRSRRSRGIRDARRQRRVWPDAGRPVAGGGRGHTRRGDRRRRPDRCLFRDPRSAGARVFVPARGFGSVAHAPGLAAPRRDPRRAHPACFRHQPGDQRDRVRCGVRGDRRGESGRRRGVLRSQSAPQAVAAAACPRHRHRDDPAMRLVPAGTGRSEAAQRVATTPRRSSAGAMRTGPRWW